jgi:hypothetical protein
VTTVLSIALVLAVLCIPVAYWLGRRSTAQRAVDRRLRRELRPGVVNPQRAADEAEGRHG